MFSYMFLNFVILDVRFVFMYSVCVNKVGIWYHLLQALVSVSMFKLDVLLLLVRSWGTACEQEKVSPLVKEHCHYKLEAVNH